jgi:hypothetical protein
VYIHNISAVYKQAEPLRDAMSRRKFAAMNNFIRGTIIDRERGDIAAQSWVCREQAGT